MKSSNNKIIYSINKYVHDLILKIFNKYKINSYIISFSGGIDSTVLLNIINIIKNDIKFKINIKAIHINHNLNQSNILENYCIKECNRIKIKIIIKNIKINKNQIKKYGFEYSARILRFKKISNYTKNNEIVMMAHNKNDNIETLLLSLKRGSLYYIKKINNVYGMNILRPLLNYTRNEIKYYAKYFNINWIEDETNFNLNIDRNFIRNKIINKLENKWPNFVNISNKSINLYESKNKLLNYFINNEIINNINKDNSLNINFLLDKNKNYIKNILINWIKKINIKIPSIKIINIILNKIINKKEYININIYNSTYIRNYKNKIFCIKEDYIKYYKYEWINKNISIKLPYKLGNLIFKNNIKNIKNIKNIHIIRKNNINENISVRINTISNKTKIKVKNFENKKYLKNIFQEYKIPFWDRKKIPMIFYNEELICIIGLLVTKKGLPSNTNKIKLINYID